MLSRRDCIWLVFGFIFIVFGNIAFTWNRPYDYVTKQKGEQIGQSANFQYVIEAVPRIHIEEPDGDPLSNFSYHRLIRGLPINKLVPCPETIGSNYSCQPDYQPVWQGASGDDLKQILNNRIKNIRMRCARYYPHLWNASLSHYGSKHNQYTFKMKRVMTSDRLQLANCWIPKMGSTFMHRAWNPLGKAPLRNNVQRDFHPSKGFFLQDFWSEQIKKPFPERYKTYTMGRSPWNRLVSVYREKCLQTDHVNWCKLDFGPGCAGKAHYVNFLIFIKCIVNRMEQEKTEFYGHVETSYSRCGVCDFPYDFVVLMENFVNETIFIFKQAGVAQPQKIMDSTRNKTIRPIEKENLSISFTDLWKQIPPALIDKIRFLYRYELMLYDYPETPFVIY